MYKVYNAGVARVPLSNRYLTNWINNSVGSDFKSGVYNERTLEDYKKLYNIPLFLNNSGVVNKPFDIYYNAEFVKCKVFIRSDTNIQLLKSGLVNSEIIIKIDGDSKLLSKDYKIYRSDGTEVNPYNCFELPNNASRTYYEYMKTYDEKLNRNTQVTISNTQSRFADDNLNVVFGIRDDISDCLRDMLDKGYISDVWDHIRTKSYKDASFKESYSSSVVHSLNFINSMGFALDLNTLKEVK